MRKIILLSLFALLTVFSARAYDFEVDGIYYNRISGTDDQVEVTYGGDGSVYTGTVAIPATVTYEGVTYAVTSIGSWAFSTCPGLTSVVIPESVTSIGYRAFSDCSGLTSVTFPESVTYVEAAFYGCTSIIAPLYNTKVFAYMPEDYSDEYAIPSGIQTIAGGAFYECSSLTSVTIPESVTSIGEAAFQGCSNLTSVILEEGVDTILAHAFAECSGLTSVTLPESVTYVEAAFYGCTSIIAPLYNSHVFAYMPEDYSGEYVIPFGIQLIASGAFDGCSGLTSVTIPGSVTAIGEGAFYGCSGLTSVTIPNSVTAIADVVFCDCSGLTSVTLPERVTSIGRAAFYGCSGLTSVTIPESVTSIGDGAFQECSGLTSVTIPNSVTSIGWRAFDKCSGLTSVILPESLDTIEWRAFHCDSLRDVYCLAENPPVCDYGTFSVHENLYVPRGRKSAYESAEEWRYFKTIYEFGFDGTGLITVKANDESMGRVTGSGEYELDELVTLEAIPNDGYHFVKWDDDNTDNPRRLKVTADITLTAIFAKNGVANESALTAAPFAYVQGRMAYLQDGLGEVEALTATGQRVYRGRDNAILLPHPGAYILRVVADGRRYKVVVR